MTAPANPIRDLIDELVGIEARLRDLAFDRLRVAAQESDHVAEEDERRIQKARRAVAKAIRDLGGEPEGQWD
jgi:hypothetical protein